MADRALRTISEDDLARLKRDREAADAEYNAALGALDAAIQDVLDLPHPPPGPDELQVTPLNQRWAITASVPPAPGGWRGRLARAVWGVVSPAFAAQEHFNAALVDHVNRSIPRERAVSEAIASTLGLVRRYMETAATFQSRLIVFLQQITPFVDTKDYEFAGLARRVGEDAQVALARLDEVSRGLAGGLSGVSDELLKRYEALALRDRRDDDQLQQVRTAVAALQQTSLALTREIARLTAAGPAPASPAAAVPSTVPTTAATGGSMRAGDRLHSHQYAGFEDLFRGSEVLVATRLADYVPLFAGAADVLDVGCGRGEMLDLLRQAGIGARGVDMNHEMVERCRQRGLDVAESDGLSALTAAGAGTLGGLIATQVVEHLEPDYLMRFLAAAAEALRPGAPIVLETINPACWSAFFDSYVRDLTHVQPVHPDTLTFLVTAAGFRDAHVLWRSPYPENGKLERLPDATRAAAQADPALRSLVETVERNVDRLNGLFFGYRDYAVVAHRP